MILPKTARGKNINVDLKDLSNCLALPSQAIMDNIFYYGEAIILGNLPLEDKDLICLFQLVRI